jgi:hypothetical protein
VRDARAVRNPVDNFILARLERESMVPAPEADRVTLLRRLSLDTIWLPPDRYDHLWLTLSGWPIEDDTCNLMPTRASPENL